MAPENPAATNDEVSLGASTPNTQLLEKQPQCCDTDAPHDIPSANVDTSNTEPFRMAPTFPFPPGTMPRRNQCKNACTNCQKACKRCDDNRPCKRCIYYDTIDTCVDSKRKERKKGLKRGPYKKRDTKAPDINDVESGHSIPQHYPSLPYIWPIHSPPTLWNNYVQTGPGAEIESNGYYHPMFAFAPFSGQASPHTGNVTESGDPVPAPGFPIGFYVAALIPYPVSYPNYTIPGGSPHGFNYPYPPSGSVGPPYGPHYSYPPMPGAFLPRHPNTAENHSGDSPQGSATMQNTDYNPGNEDSMERGNDGMNNQDVEGDRDTSDEEISSVIE